MIKKNDIHGARILEIGIIIFLGGIYLMPEKIKIFSVFYVCLLLLFYLVFNRKVRIYRENILLCLYCLLGLFSTVIWKIGTLENAVEFIVSIGIGLLACSMCMNVYIFEKYIKAFNLVVCIVLLGCFLQILAPNLLVSINKMTLGNEQFLMFYDFYSWKHMVGFSYQTGVTAHYLCMFVMLLISKFVVNKRKDKKKKILYACLFCVGIIFVLLTEKRSSLLAIFCVLLVILVIYNRKHIINILVACVGLGIGMLAVLFFTDAGQKMLTRTLGNNPFTGRLKIYGVLWEMIKKHPLIGNGFGSTLTQVTEFTNGHNIYLQTMAEVGLIGLIVLLGILFGNLVRTIKIVLHKVRIKEISYVEIFCLEYQIYFVIVGLMGNILYDVFPLVVYMVTSGMMYSMKEKLLHDKKKRIIEYVSE